jgi:hypothetical protein
MILHGTLASAEDLVRFRQEAETLAKLSHPNFVQIYDLGTFEVTAGKQPFLVLEYVSGGNLYDWLGDQPLALPEAATLVLVLARAMQIAHAEAIVHRDLKPGNILFAEETRIQSRNETGPPPSLNGPWIVLKGADGKPHTLIPKITDFGLAKHLKVSSALTVTGRAMGTPSYMAPEQLGRSQWPIGPPTDVYALGAILYECLTGRPPHLGQSATATVAMTAMDPAKPPSAYRKDIPAALDAIALKCLEKEPGKRYESAGGLADDLEAWLSGNRVHARPRRALSPMQWARRHPALAGSIGTVLLILLGLVTLQVVGALDPLRRAALEGFPIKGPGGAKGGKGVHDFDGVALVYLSDLRPVGQRNWPFSAAQHKKGPPRWDDKKGPPGGDFFGKKGFDREKDFKDKDFDEKGPPGGGGKGPPSDDEEVWVTGKFYPKGIFMHPPGDDSASLSFDLDRQYQHFSAEVSLNDGLGSAATPCIFRIYGDDRKLWASRPVATQEDRQQATAVDIRGVKILRLEVECPGKAEKAHMVWIDPRVDR